MFFLLSILSLAWANPIELEAPPSDTGTQISVTESYVSLKVTIGGPTTLFITHNPFLRKNKLEFKNRSKKLLFTSYRTSVSGGGTKLSLSDEDFVIFDGDTKKRDHISPIRNSKGEIIAQFANESTAESKVFRVYPQSFTDEPLAEVYFLSESWWLNQPETSYVPDLNRGLPFDSRYLISLLLFHLGDEKKSSSIKTYATNSLFLASLLASGGFGWLIP